MPHTHHVHGHRNGLLLRTLTRDTSPRLHRLTCLHLFRCLFSVTDVQPRVTGRLRIVFHARSKVRRHPLAEHVRSREASLSHAHALRLVRGSTPIRTEAQRAYRHARRHHLSVPIQDSRAMSHAQNGLDIRQVCRRLLSVESHRHLGIGRQSRPLSVFKALEHAVGKSATPGAADETPSTPAASPGNVTFIPHPEGPVIPA